MIGYLGIIVSCVGWPASIYLFKKSDWEDAYEEERE